MRDDIEQTVMSLLAIPEDRFAMAVWSLEQRAENPDVLKIRDRIRERMVKVRPPRRLTPIRIFCDPFEEMLRDNAGEAGNWIPRAAILPIWRLVEPLIEPGILSAIRAEIEILRMPDRLRLGKLGTPLWEAAAKELGRIVKAARAGDQAALGALAGDPNLLAHVEVVAAACQVAPAIQELKGIFPNRRFEKLQSAEREGLQLELARIGAAGRCDLRCLLYVVAHWSVNPADIFGLCDELDLGTPTPLGKALFEQRDKMVVGLLGEQIGQLKGSIDDGDIDFGNCAELARVAAELLGSTVELIQGGMDSGAMGHVTQMKRELGTIVKDQVVPPATRVLSAIWGSQQSPRTMSSDQFATAEDAARTMSKCRHVGRSLGVESAISRNIATSLHAIRGDVATVISELKRGSAQDRGASAQLVLTHATRMLEILEGPECAYEFFRSREAEIRAHS